MWRGATPKIKWCSWTFDCQGSYARILDKRVTRFEGTLNNTSPEIKKRTLRESLFKIILWSLLFSVKILNAWKRLKTNERNYIKKGIFRRYNLVSEKSIAKNKSHPSVLQGKSITLQLFWKIFFLRIRLLQGNRGYFLWRIRVFGNI